MIEPLGVLLRTSRVKRRATGGSGGDVGGTGSRAGESGRERRSPQGLARDVVDARRMGAARRFRGRRRCSSICSAGGCSSTSPAPTLRSPVSASLAYTFGLRHAFDADHIAAIDNTTRKLLQDGKRSMGVGFFFSLGHSTRRPRARGGARASRRRRSTRSSPAFQDIGSYDRRLRLRHLPDRDRPAQPRSSCSTSSASSGR